MKCFKSTCMWYCEIWVAYVASIWSNAAGFVMHIGYQRSLYIRNWLGIASENTGRRNRLVRPDGIIELWKATYCGEGGAATLYPTDRSGTTGYGPTMVDSLNLEDFQIEGQQKRCWRMKQMLSYRSICMMMSKDFEDMLCEDFGGCNQSRA
jgi:hypothetical protein